MIQGTPATRQQLLRHCTIVGSVVLLCGLGFLLLERKSEPTDTVSDITVLDTTENVTIKTETPLIESVAVVDDGGKFSPIMSPIMSDGVLSPPMIPGVPTDGIATMTLPADDSTYSPWNVAPRQPENPNPTVATQPVIPHVPPPPPVAVAMAPMIDMSAPMPVSPHEQQLHAQPNMPVDPFIQTQSGAAPGGMPMHAYQGHPAGMAPPQNVQRPAPPPLYPQYVPPSAVQNVHGQPGHPQPYVGPMPTPIPSGVSTLSPQGGYPPPHHPGGVTLPGPRQSSDFYYAPPSSSYRRVY